MLHKFLQMHQFTSIEWRAHLGDCTAISVLSVPESKLHSHKHFGVEGKFEHLCFGQTILVATDNTVVSCINKEGSMRSGSVCPPVEVPAASSDRSFKRLARYPSTECN